MSRKNIDPLEFLSATDAALIRSALQNQATRRDVMGWLMAGGVGIDTDDLPRIGDPFFQARSSYDRRHDGTGLGLSIVKGLLALHGGDIAIESRIGEGTRVTIRLPVDCERTRKIAEIAGADISPLGRAATAPPAAPSTAISSEDRVKLSA